MYTQEQTCYVIALAILTNLFFKSSSIYFLILSIFLYQFFYETWLFVLVQSLCYFAYNHLNNNRLPRRMVSLNFLWMLCFVIWRQRQILDLPDTLKLNAFFLGWLLGAVYVKNKVLIIWKIIKKSKQ